MSGPDATRTADRLAQRAARRHRHGRRDEATRLYQAALEACAGHPPSLHGLGCLAHEDGRADLAIGLIGQAVAAAPEAATYAISLGLALLDRGHAEAARAALHVAVLRDDADPRAHRALAQALSRLGRLEAAERHLQRALTLDPGSAAAWLALGGILRDRGAVQPALDAFRQATRLAPQDPLAWHALAALAAAAGALEEAEAAFRRTAVLLPDDAAAQANLGTALFGLDRLEAALPCLRRALALAPDAPLTLSSLGLVLIGLGETIDAERILARASRLDPQAGAIAVNHGTALAALQRAPDAEAVFRSVLGRDPSHRQARFNLATLLLARGARGEGWAAFEARLGLLGGETDASLPQWDGSPLADGCVLVRAEQGLGDTIQFLRWVEPASRRARIRLEVPPAMLRLARAGGVFDPARVQVVAPGEPITGCAAQAPLLSLPHRLGDATIPPLRLRADPDATAAWRSRLPPGVRVGLAWAGAAAYRFDRARSIPLEQLAPLLGVPGVVFVTVRPGPDLASDDLAGTASLIAALDLVISVDTMIAHLAGALGRPVWLLDRFGGDWRWQAGFDHGRAWYPTLRRFAQTQALPPSQGWTEVIAAVAAALAAESQGQGSALDPLKAKP